MESPQGEARVTALGLRRPWGPPVGGWGDACGALGSGFPLTGGPSSLCSVEGEAPSSETGTSLDSPSAYHQGPSAPGSGLGPDHSEHTPGGAYGLYAGPPGQQRTRRPKLQHSTSILRKQAEEEAIKRSRSLSESYELSSDLQDKQVGGRPRGPRGRGVGVGGRLRCLRGLGRRGPLLGPPRAAGDPVCSTAAPRQGLFPADVASASARAGSSRNAEGSEGRSRCGTFLSGLGLCPVHSPPRWAPGPTLGVRTWCRQCAWLPWRPLRSWDPGES